MITATVRIRGLDPAVIISARQTQLQILVGRSSMCNNSTDIEVRFSVPLLRTSNYAGYYPLTLNPSHSHVIKEYRHPSPVIRNEVANALETLREKT